MLIIYCVCTFKDLEQMVPKYIKSVSLTTIRRHDRKYFQYMDVHRKILINKAAKYAVVMYPTHRKVQTNLRNVDVFAASNCCAFQ